MMEMWKFRQFGIIVLVVGTLTVITCLVAFVLSRTLPFADGSPAQESEMPNTSIVLEKQTPLDCRIVPIGAAERKAEMEKSEGLRAKLRDRPALATPHLFRNPLVASENWVKVEVENSSGGDFTFRTYRERDFLVGAWVQDSARKDLVYKNRGLNSLKRLGFTLTDTDHYPPKTMKAEQVETFPLQVFSAGPGECNIKPGKYSVRAGYLYWAPDGTERQVQSLPFMVTVTEEDIREWEDLWK